MVNRSTVNKHTSLIDYFNGDELAASVWKSKYADVGEHTPFDMHTRLTTEFANIEFEFQSSEKYKSKANLSEYGKLRSNLDFTDIFELFDRFKYIIPQGSIMASLGTKKIASLSNCFVIGRPHDSYSGIMEKDEQLVQLMKRRGGVGIDISSLRPRGTTVTNAAKTSTGAASFMERFSNSTREVAQGGRRGALMITIDCRHPDVLDFINSKKDRTKVTGANISVMLRDEFMEAVEKDADYILRWPCESPLTLNAEERFPFFFKELPYDTLIPYTTTDGNSEIFFGYYKKVKAKEYYNAIVENAWENAEPGQMFVDRHWDYSPDSIYERYRGITSNPCGEIFMSAYDACRLFALNLFSFIRNPFTNGCGLDVDLLYRMAYEQQRLSDDLVTLEVRAIDKILDKIRNSDNPTSTEYDMWVKIREITSAGRRTGNGITGLGDMIAAMGLKYDSSEAKLLIQQVFYIKMQAELDCTIDLAQLRGTFEDCNPEAEFGVDMSCPANSWYEFVMKVYPDQARRMYLFGRRNVSFSTAAPTGTVSLMTQTSSGIEPLFKAYHIRRRKVNPGEEGTRIDFTDQNGDKWMEYPVLHPKFKDWCVNKYGSELFVDEMSKQAMQLAFETSPWYGSEADDIDWIERVKIQGIIQDYTTHSISSTINLPTTATKEDISAIYFESWKQGLKGVTVYRDGSRTGVLITEPTVQNDFIQHDAPKRPRRLPCEIHITTKAGIEYLVAVGLLNNKPYELFTMENKHTTEKFLTGEIVKIKKGVYNIELSDGTLIEDITNNDMTPEEEDLTRMVSMSLRHGANIEFVVEQLNKTKSIVSFSKATARVLKKYIPEGKIGSGDCPECNGILRYEEGCKKCTSCGYTAC